MTMGLFDAYKGATKEMDGNFNEFIPQYIQAKLNGTESVRKCLYKVLADYKFDDSVGVTPDLNLSSDLGLDDLGFGQMLSVLRDRLIFTSLENSFLTWVNEMIGKFNDRECLDQCDFSITVKQLEEKINAGCPMYAVKVK